MKVRSTSKGLMLMFLLTAAAPAMAYEEDTHFQITYIICRCVGMTPNEALRVAAVDQGMDDSPGTVANNGAIPHVAEEYLWHALDRDGKMGPKGVLARKRELFQIALSRKSDDQKLFFLGVFFHYQQDTWSHRHHYDGNPHSKNNFTTYDTPLGHARHGHQPDRPPFDPVAALMNLQDGIYFANQFMRRGLHRKPNPFFVGIVATGGKQDDGWKDSRNGKFFHQLAIDGGPNTAKRFLSRLIIAQINAYSTSIDANPFFALRYTADEVGFDKVRAALQGVCNNWAVRIGQRINIPSKLTKEQQGFLKLTTQQLLNGAK